MCWNVSLNLNTKFVTIVHQFAKLQSFEWLKATVLCKKIAFLVTLHLQGVNTQLIETCDFLCLNERNVNLIPIWAVI